MQEEKEDQQIREALNAHWHASAVGDLNAEHDIYDDNAICDYPQSGERILGRANLQALRSHHPGKPSDFTIRRMLGQGDLWITESCPEYALPSLLARIGQRREEHSASAVPSMWWC